VLERMFNYENPVWQFMGRVADILILNIMAIVFSLPIITIGASWTALYYSLLKVVRKEDTYVWKEYWHSFKSNFKQATIIWLILLPFIIFISLDLIFWYINVSEGYPDALPKILKITTVIVAIIVTTETLYVFPILSHFENTVKNTMVNAFMVSIVNIPSTILFIIIFAIPIIIVDLNINFLLFDVMFGLAGPVYVACFAWNRIFKKLEPPTEDDEDDDDEEDDDEEKIFSDEISVGNEMSQHIVLEENSNQHIRLEAENK